MVTALIAVVCVTLGACEPAKAPPPRIAWHHSIAHGSPAAGRLERGVRLPAAGAAFFTWDPVKRRSPNRAWRRWGTARLVRIVLRVARDFRAAHPQSPRMASPTHSSPGRRE